jgi:excisionase family DNA binding protein
MTDRLLLSKKEAATLLSISVRSVEYLVSKKELPARRVGRRVLIPFSGLLQFSRHDHTALAQPLRQHDPDRSGGA